VVFVTAVNVRKEAASGPYVPEAPTGSGAINPVRNPEARSARRGVAGAPYSPGLLALRIGGLLTKRDWTRAVFTTEIIFAKRRHRHRVRVGVIQGGTDAHWIGVLRSLRLKLRR
jgi:hypothetical protein